MSTHPQPTFQTEGIAEYISKHNIESIISSSVNTILQDLPIDPYSSLYSILKQHSLPLFTITQISLINTYTTDFTEIPSLIFTLSYKGTTNTAYTLPLPFTSTAYDLIKSTNSNEIIFKTFTDIFESHFVNYVIESLDAFNTKLLSLTPSDNPIAFAIANAISYGVLIAMSKIKNESFHVFIKDTYPRYIVNEASCIPNLGFSLFKTGKNAGSKVKFERFILFINNNQHKLSKDTLVDIVNKIYVSLRKALTSGKAGENGMRVNNEGSYFPPQDTLNDILKLIETIITEVNAPEDALYIGIDCNANNYYNEQSKTYDIEGAKKAPDTDQTIDYYVKLVTEHPLIRYLEEPIAEVDVEGWEKIIDKFAEEKPNVTLWSKSKESKQNNVVDNNEQQQDKANVDSEGNVDIKVDVLKTEPLPSNKIKQLETLSQEDEKAKTEEGKNEQDGNDEENNNMISFHIGDSKSFISMMKGIEMLKEEGEVNVTLWDNDYETNQSSVVDIGIAIHADNIILNGLSLKENKLAKIIQYIETINELY